MIGPDQLEVFNQRSRDIGELAVTVDMLMSEHMLQKPDDTLFADARRILAKPANREQIRAGLFVLQAQHRWHSSPDDDDVLNDPDAYFARMAEILRKKQFPAWVIYAAVDQQAEANHRIPSIGELVNWCEQCRDIMQTCLMNWLARSLPANEHRPCLPALLSGPLPQDMKTWEVVKQVLDGVDHPGSPPCVWWYVEMALLIANWLSHSDAVAVVDDTRRWAGTNELQNIAVRYALHCYALDRGFGWDKPGPDADDDDEGEDI